MVQVSLQYFQFTSNKHDPQCSTLFFGGEFHTFLSTKMYCWEQCMLKPYLVDGYLNDSCYAVSCSSSLYIAATHLPHVIDIIPFGSLIESCILFDHFTVVVFLLKLLKRKISVLRSRKPICGTHRDFENKLLYFQSVTVPDSQVNNIVVVYSFTRLRLRKGLRRCKS